MQSKTYRAKTMKDALTRVRRDLGGDALILSGARGPSGAGFLGWVREPWSRSSRRIRCRRNATLPAAKDQPPLPVRPLRRTFRRKSASSLAGCTRWSKP